jgi:hypothetical protein
MTDKELIDGLARQILTMQIHHVGTLRASMRLAHDDNPLKAPVLLVKCTAHEHKMAMLENRDIQAAVFAGQMTFDEYDAWDISDHSVLTPMNDAARELTKV